MRIQASAGRGGHVGDSVKRVALTADNDREREFVTSVYRIVGGDSRDAQDKGVAWMREYLKSFPPFEGKEK